MTTHIFIESDLHTDHIYMTLDAFEFYMWVKPSNNIQIHNLHGPASGTNHLQTVIASSSGEYIPIGSVQFVNRVRALLGHNPIFVDNWPTYLDDCVLQNHGECTLTTIPQYPIFIKPISNKLFTGMVLYSDIDLQSLHQMYEDIHPDIHVYWSEPITFTAEYRAVISNGKLISFAHYTGESDSEIYKNYWVAYGYIICDVIPKLKHVSNMNTHVIDIGVTDDYKIGIVECANHITTSAIYTSAIDRLAYCDALLSCKILNNNGIDND